MKAIVERSSLKGTITSPPSKSCAHRLLVAAALSVKSSRIMGLDLFETGWDVQATRNALAALGASFNFSKKAMQVLPIVEPPRSASIDCGESGTTLRFALPIAASFPVRTRFNGNGRLKDRPIEELTEQLSKHGAQFSKLTPLPFTVQGPMNGGVFELPGNVSSQYISGLMFALPRLSEDSEIRVTTELESANYIELTMQTLRMFGVNVYRDGDTYFIKGGQEFTPPDEPLVVEGDWSGASFFLAANALGADIAISGLADDSLQSDRRIVEVIERLKYGDNEIDLRDMPDSAPILAVAAAIMPSVSQRVRFVGIERLRLKESDRIAAIVDGLNAISIHAVTDGRSMTVPTGVTPSGGVVNGCGDHRIVMAFAIAGLFASASVTIEGAQCVSKSYVRFWHDIEKLGGKISMKYTD